MSRSDNNLGLPKAIQGEPGFPATIIEHDGVLVDVEPLVEEVWHVEIDIPVDTDLLVNELVVEDISEKEDHPEIPTVEEVKLTICVGLFRCFR